MPATLPGFDLSGKIAVVTGGAKGIGAGICEVLAQAGAHIVIADFDFDGAQEMAGKLRAASAVQVDLAQESSIVQCCRTIAEKHGNPWILVNNAGLQDRELLLDATAEEWDRIHRVNIRGAFLMTREIARQMVGAGTGGRIVNISSGALHDGIIKGLTAYTSSKAAMTGLTMQSAFELVEHGITVNSVLPGAVITPGAIAAKGPEERDGPASRPRPLGFAEPADIGHAVLYFASPAAAKVTNQELAVDSGFSIA